MKRILTSILVLLVLTLSVHPMLSLNFCQGEFQTLQLSSLDNDNRCCIDSELGDKESTKFSSLILFESQNHCCTTINLDIVTDNFTLDVAQSIQTSRTLTSLSDWFIANYLNNLATPATTVISYFNIPSDGLYLKTLDFLSLICVYRL